MFYIFSVLFFYLLSSRPAQAISDFTITNNLTYTVSPDLKTQVSQEVSITNNISSIYAKEYSLSIQSKNIQNLKVSDDSGLLSATLDQSSGVTKITIPISNPVLGKDKAKEITIRYSADPLVKNGSLYELKIPIYKSISSQDTTTNLKVVVPTTIGELSTASPKPILQTPSGDNYEIDYNFSTPNTPPILLNFGEAQVFDFNLTYEVTPDDNKIALPPDTATQKVSLDSISPKPQKITVDPDGNWLALYPSTFSGVVTVTGKAKITPPHPGNSPDLNYLATLTKPSPLWQSDSADIQTLASSLSGPKDIYDYVVKNLSYNFSKIDNPHRTGALETLQNPTNSLCTEFVDLTIALLRAKGIPSREHEGYAQTSNENSKPTNPNSDIIHSWVEYYDASQKQWKQIDPTWGNTTGGVDYFSSLDQNRLTFVIHGQSPFDPKPAGSYRSPGSSSQIDIKNSTSSFVSNILPPQLTVHPHLSSVELTLQNIGPQTLSNFQVSNQTISLAPLESKTIFLPLTISDYLTPGKYFYPLTIKLNSKTITQTKPVFSIFLFQISLIATILLLLLVAIILISRHPHEKNN